MSEAQKETYLKFKAEVEKHVAEKYAEHPEETKNSIDQFLSIDTCYRFLVARDFNLPKALEMIVKSIAWRLEY